jgi:organic hydroperoxide reductase OsmC/OhrA
MPEMNFEGTATWKGGTECELTVKGKQIVTVSPPPSFGGKEGYCVPEDIFAAALASCINTLFLLIAKNSQLSLKGLETKATVKMNVEGLEKLIFTNVHFMMNVGLENDNEHERKKLILFIRWRRRFVQLGNLGAKMFQSALNSIINKDKH